MAFNLSDFIEGLSDAIDNLAARNEYEMSLTEMENLRGNLRRMLEDLEARQMNRTGAATFGNSEGGTYMAHHTTIAERHVGEALTAIIDGVSHYRQAVDETERLAVENDDMQADDYRALANSPWIADDGVINTGNDLIDNPSLGTD